jgi:hypothetical protein
MRNCTLLLGLLVTSTLACGEDPPTRPDDGTVEAWDECIWDGQEIYALCKPELVCAWNGICVPRCENLNECSFEGFVSECGIESEENVCRVRCNEDRECPVTGGSPLKCFQFHCIRDQNAPES